MRRLWRERRDRRLGVRGAVIGIELAIVALIYVGAGIAMLRAIFLRRAALVERNVMMQVARIEGASTLRQCAKR